ncbi:hypothetical protein [Streptomyces sp. NPDC058739]|uniref:hypothetical protein n=1 Tax=Streptomyces sp. NPDC058739 TaxID=3346618 RepID=UPI0036BC7714
MLASVVGSTVWVYGLRTAYPRYDVVVPDTFHGMRPLSGSPLNDQVEWAVAQAPEGLTAFGHVYGDPATNTGRVGAYGWTGDMHEMSPDMLRSFADSLRAGVEQFGVTVDDSWQPDAGPGGGWMECMDYTAFDGSRQATCLWGDKGSVGTVLFPDPNLVGDADRLTRELRTALVHPSQS